MLWSPTQAFPPLANSTTNFVSYVLVEMMTGQGLGDLINRFRKKIGLEACEFDVGAWYGNSGADTIYLLLVRSRKSSSST